MASGTDSRAHPATVGTRARTRRAILDAASELLTTNESVSLAEIAVAAGVGRTTIHRYFTDRSELLTALGLDILHKVEESAGRARLDEGPGLPALLRLVQELFELGDQLLLIFDLPQLMSGPEWEQGGAYDHGLLRALERGQADGTIDPELGGAWVQTVVWSMLYGAREHVRDTGCTTYEAQSLCLRTVEKVLRPGP